MKKSILVSIVCLLMYANLHAQAPELLNYQGIAHGPVGPITDQEIGIKISIIDNSVNGVVLYSERHLDTTNTFGLYTLVIGSGSILSGNMGNIDWDSGDKFMKVEIDPNGGNTYVVLGTTQLLSVPYALHAGSTAKLSQMGANSGEVLKWNGSDWGAATDSVGSGGVWNDSTTFIHYNDGDVGIGTSTPNAKQEISHNSSLIDPHLLLNENGNDYSRIRFQNNNGSNYWTIAAYIANNYRNDRLNFWNGTGGDVMTLTGDGELGLGVGISPKTGLHIGNGMRVLFGTDTLGNGDKLMFLPDLHAFRVGTVATGAASTYWNRDSIGLYSFASGYNTRAQGFGATAMGRDTEATNSYAFASGYFTNADGQYSTAMGFNTDAFGIGATALGYSTDAEANYSFAAGHFAEAQAIYSVAIGTRVQAQSYASAAFGRHNVGGGDATAWIANNPIFEIGIGSSATAKANAFTVLKNGNVGIGTTTPGALLHVDGTIRIGSLEELTDGGTFLIESNASIIPETNNSRTLGNGTNRWSAVYAVNGTINTSDRRDKKNIQSLDYGLKEVMELRPVRFQWKDYPETAFKLGFIAQELQPILSEVVKDKELITNEDGTTSSIESNRLGVYYSDIIPVTVKAIQEQQAIINSQQEQIEKQIKTNSDLQKQIDELKALILEE